jgi:hypothetical protein
MLLKKKTNQPLDLVNQLKVLASNLIKTFLISFRLSSITDYNLGSAKYEHQTVFFTTLQGTEWKLFSFSSITLHAGEDKFFYKNRQD